MYSHPNSNIYSQFLSSFLLPSVPVNIKICYLFRITATFDVIVYECLKLYNFTYTYIKTKFNEITGHI